jgi:hypothetical protein
LSHPVTDGRNTQGTLTAVALWYHDPFNRIGFIRLGSQCFFQLPNECGCPFVFLDGLEGDAIDTGAPFVGTDKAVGKLKDVGPIYLVVQGVEAAGRFLLGLAVELPL